MGWLGDCMFGVSDLLSINNSVKCKAFINRDLATELVVSTYRDNERA